MYYDYFGLKQAPFKITPDTNLFYPGGNRGEILNALVYAVTSGEGIVKVVGEVGSGKTMLCRMLQQELPDNIEIVYLANPSLAPEDILHAIAFELKLSVTPEQPRLQVMNSLQEYLLKKHSAGQQVVVFVEEAQSMPLDTLEEIRFLSNLETQQNKLLQIILFGQPELDEKIALREIRQLKERITYSFQLNPFKIEDVRDYIYSRLRSCGYRSGEVFSNSAIREIRGYSRGLVRRINIIADKAMLAAYASSMSKVSVKHVRQAARDSDFSPPFQPVWFVAGISLLLLCGLFVYYWVGVTQPGEVALQQAEPDQGDIQQGQETITPAISGAAVQHPGPDLTEPTTVLQMTTVLAIPTESAEIGNQERIISDSEAETVTLDAVTVQQRNAAENNAEVATVQQEVQEVAKLVSSPQGKDQPPVTEPGPGLREEVLTVADSRIRDIMDLNGFYLMQDRGDMRLSDQELLVFRRWYASLPEDEAAQYGPVPEEESCWRCWAMIYRPLIPVKKY